jgi:Sulfotransferase family
VNNIFICGCGHSGTTLLLALLLEHSKCTGIRYENRNFFNIDEDSAVEFLNSFYDNSFKYFVEKTPTNVYKIEVIKRRFPDAKIIVCYKNPLDVVASIMARGFDIEYAINRYNNDNNAWLPFAHNVITVCYEDLVKDAAGSLTRLCSLLDIEYEDTMLDFFKNDNMYFNITNDQYKKYIETGQFSRLEGNEHRVFRNHQLRSPITDMSGLWKNILSGSAADNVVKSTKLIAQQLGY